jgi:predicted polyphosphate/ATP-dependent NAD kinase
MAAWGNIGRVSGSVARASRGRVEWPHSDPVFGSRTMGAGVGRRRVGIVVNPIAGMGGRVGLKGTDGAATLARARALGAEPVAAARCALALEAMGDAAERIEAPATLGTGEDTARAAAALARDGVDLILFAGGDGTARDVLSAVGDKVPILGVPTGVKMHSAVFGTSARAAGRLAARFLSGDAKLRDAEVMDLDEDALREGRVSARLFGVARVPHERGLLQACKAGARPDDEAALDALARILVRDWPDGRLMILGCGTTMRRIKRALGFEGTLIGVDVALGGRPIALDVNEQQLLRLLDRSAEAGIVAAATGGQGFLFGRGNQQISAEVLRRVGRENVMVVTGAQKLAALDPAVLHVDTGDAAVDAMLAGYIQVHTAPGQRMVMRVAAH